LVCFRCDGKGKFENEFGLIERCESCQGEDMTFEKANDQVSNDQYDWEMKLLGFGVNEWKV